MSRELGEIRVKSGRKDFNCPKSLVSFVRDNGAVQTSRQMGQYDLAAEQYLRALDLRNSTGDKRGAAIESSSLITLFSYQGRYGTALNAEEDVLETFRELQEQGLWLAGILNWQSSSVLRQSQVLNYYRATKPPRACQKSDCQTPKPTRFC